MYGANYLRKYTSKVTKKEKLTDYYWYRCANFAAKGKAICKGLRIPAKPLEDSVIERLKQISQNKEFIQDKKKLLESMRKQLKPTTKSTVDEIKRLESEATKLQNRQQSLLEMKEDKLIDNSVFKNEFEKIKGLLDKNMIRQSEIKTRNKNADINLTALEFSLSEIENFSKNWDFLDEHGKRARIHSIVKEIIASEDKLEITLFIELPLEVSGVLSNPSGSGPDIGKFTLVGNLYQRNLLFSGPRAQG